MASWAKSSGNRMKENMRKPGREGYIMDMEPCGEEAVNSRAAGCLLSSRLHDLRVPMLPFRSCCLERWASLRTFWSIRHH